MSMYFNNLYIDC